MPDLRDRLRELDSLVVPDVMERARQIGPKRPMRAPSGLGRRIAVVTFALLVAAALIAFLSRSFDRAVGPIPGDRPIQPSVPCAFDVATIALPQLPESRLVGSSVAGTSLQDLWVLASTKNRSRVPHLLHYDGTTWSEVDLPADRSVSDLVAPGPGTVWGIASNGVAQWDGSTWTRSLRGSAITDLDVESPSSVWATGSVYDEVSGTTAPSVTHWDGSDWTTSFRATDGPYAPRRLTAISAWGPDDAWAVGMTRLGSRNVPIAVHWDGTTWSSRPTASLEPARGTDVVAVGPDDALMRVDEVVLRWDTVAWFDAGYRAPSSMDIPFEMAFGDAGVWAKIWNTSVGRWDGRDWHVQGLRRVYAYAMSVIDDDAAFVGSRGGVEIYSCQSSTPDLSA